MANSKKIGDTLRGNYASGVSGTLLAVTEKAPESQRRRLADTLRISSPDYRRMIEEQVQRELTPESLFEREIDALFSERQ